jgi:hypothetical protein
MFIENKCFRCKCELDYTNPNYNGGVFAIRTKELNYNIQFCKSCYDKISGGYIRPAYIYFSENYLIKILGKYWISKIKEQDGIHK